MIVNVIDVACRSHVGHVRKLNEDAYVALPKQGVVAIADGMGGHRAGEVASQIAVEVAADALCDMQETESPDELYSLLYVERAVEKANQKIVARVRQDPELAGMGTTLVAIAFRHGRVFFAHVGDSRLYRFRNGRLKSLTRDHSLVQQLMDQGLFRDREEAHEAGVGDNVLIRSLGMDPEVEVDVSEAPIQPDDLYLLCTDGLCGKVPDDAIAAVLSGADGDLEACSERLQQLALDAGGVDNITVVVVRPQL